MQEEQKAEVETVLGELEVLDKPRIKVLNKSDLLTPVERETAAHQEGVLISARNGEGVKVLLDRIDAALVADPIVDQVINFPQSKEEPCRHSMPGRSSTIVHLKGSGAAGCIRHGQRKEVSPFK